jgi:hypothetical protein
MESLYLGFVGRISPSCSRDQLSASKIVLGSVQIRNRFDDARLLSLPHLVADWRLKNLRLPFCQGSLRYDMYVYYSSIPTLP